MVTSSGTVHRTASAGKKPPITLADIRDLEASTRRIRRLAGQLEQAEHTERHLLEVYHRGAALMANQGLDAKEMRGLILDIEDLLELAQRRLEALVARADAAADWHYLAQRRLLSSEAPGDLLADIDNHCGRLDELGARLHRATLAARQLIREIRSRREASHESQ